MTQPIFFYLEFASGNVAGLVHEDCITKMRLMSLVDLGSDESCQIPYSLIKDTLRVKASLLFLTLLLPGVPSTSWLNILVQFCLQIDDDEVELWVVKAITVKLMDCKMDQMNQVVLVRYSIQFPFQFLIYSTFSKERFHYTIDLDLYTINWFPFGSDMSSRCSERVFGQQQWQNLRSKLLTWRVMNFPELMLVFVVVPLSISAITLLFPKPFSWYHSFSEPCMHN